MANFVPRTTAPDNSNAYYYANNPFYQSGYGMPNCTCYAWGRFYELSGQYPSLSLGDAENWYGKDDGYQRGQTPKLGAVICWRRGTVGDDSDGAGHVAVVEKINADGSIETSNSAWNSTLFYMQTLTRESGYTWDSRYTFQGFIYNPVNFDTEEDTSDPKKIWDYFMGKIGNEYGVAGLMGNLEAESNLCSYRLQGDFSSGYATSKTYTANVDSGAISKEDFVHNGPNGGGYGLAQWTFYTRKQALYERWKSGGYTSIGSLELACDHLWHELQYSYPGVLSVLKTATSVRVASDKVLHDFENPADQSTAMEEKRASMGQAWYDKYHGSSPGGGGGTPWVPVPRKKMALLLMVASARRLTR